MNTKTIQHPERDYATRWPGLTPPTLAECDAFCAGAVLTTGDKNASTDT